mmetsp:Transcript_18006/g.26865  ORF Transcript_18006/g.26865 Transcript_18006/m.26865 type:complete len:362 (+) Transcript_18006:835-1920(+)
MHGSGGSFSRRKETRYNFIVCEFTIIGKVCAHDFSVVVGGDSTHVVVHGGKDRNGLLGHVHSRKDGSRLGNTRQTLREQVSWKMIQVQVDVILLGSHATSLANLHGHGATDNVSGRKILGRGSVAFHEALTVCIAQDSSLTAASFRDETARPVNSGGVELNELSVLVREAGSESHGVSIAGASVRRGAGEVRTAVPASGQDCVLSANAMYGSVLHVQCHNAVASAVLVHEQVHGKVLNEVGGVKGEGAAVQGVEHGMSCAIGRTGTAVGLAAFAILEGLASEGALVDFSVFRAAEGKAEFFQLQHCLWCFSAHVMNSVLVTQPITALDSVIHMPPPIILTHIPKRRINTTLSRHRVRSSRK